jgi:hypothetical protein
MDCEIVITTNCNNNITNLRNEGCVLPVIIMTQGETQMQRMVVDRQKGENQIRVQEIQSGYTGLWVRAGSYKVQKQARGSKQGGLEKGEMQKESEWGKTRWLTWKHTRQNWHRETGNTGINTLGKISDTWRGWRQSQGQVKQIRV